MVMAGAVHAEYILAAWEFSSGTGASYAADGIAASEEFSENVRQMTVIGKALQIGSADGTFGSGADIGKSADTEVGALNVMGSPNAPLTRTASFTVTNNGEKEIKLSHIRFDFLRNNEDSVKDFTVEISGDEVKTKSVLKENSRKVTAGKAGDGRRKHDDIDAKLAGYVLPAGGSVTLKMSFKIAGSAWTAVDNIAITGE